MLVCDKMVFVSWFEELVLCIKYVLFYNYAIVMQSRRYEQVLHRVVRAF